MSLYETLGVEKDASPDTIKKAFRKLAMKHHPDRGGDRATMQAVQLAYDVLMDADRRVRYDETGSTDSQPTTREKAAEALTQLVNQVIDLIDKGEGDDADFTDPLVIVRDQIHAAVKQQDEQRKKAERRIAHRRKVLKRLRRKEGEGQDLLQAVLMGAILTLEGEIHGLGMADELCHAALDILAEYGYEVEERSLEVMDATMRRGIERAFGMSFKR